MSTSILRPGSVPATARQQRESLGALTRESAGPSDEHHLSVPVKQFPSQLLEVSPYTEPEHMLDLSTVNTPCRLLAQALTTIEPLTPDYATTAYSATFNWATVFANLRTLAASESFYFPQAEFYVVEFRSKLKENIDTELLFKLDKESHREATASGGLLKYWYGSPDVERRNLATCLWRSKEDAIEGGKGLWHKRARTSISALYESISVSGLRLLIEDGARDWKFEPWAFH